MLNYRIEICRENFPVLVYARTETLDAAVALLVPLTPTYRWIRIVDNDDRILVEKYDLEPAFLPQEGGSP